MPIAEDFREQVLRALTCLQDRGYIPLDAEDTPDYDEWDHLCDWIGIEFGWEGLLEKTPVHPPELRVIAQEIRQLQMVQAMVGRFPYFRHPERAVCQRELPILTAKLKEILDYLPEPTMPSTIQPCLQRKSRGPRPDIAKSSDSAVTTGTAGRNTVLMRLGELSICVRELIGQEEELRKEACETDEPEAKARASHEAEEKAKQWHGAMFELMPEIERLEICLLSEGPQAEPIRQEIKQLYFRAPEKRGPYAFVPDAAKVKAGLSRLDLLMDAASAIVAEPVTAQAGPTTAHSTTSVQSHTGRKHRLRSRIKKNLKPPARRASTVATIIEELYRLRPRMTGSTADYEALRREHPDFLTFKVAGKHSELKEKVLNLQGHTQHKRLAMELAAANFGVALATVQTDWKHFKPERYRKLVHN